MSTSPAARTAVSLGRLIGAAVAQMPMLLWIAGADSRRTYLNQAALALTGLSDQQDLDRWAEHVHPEDRERYLAAWLGAFDSRGPFRVEYRLRRQDGSYCWMSDDGMPLFLPRRGFAGFFGLCTAMDGPPERPALPDPAAHEPDELGAIVDRVAVGIAHVDRDRRLLYANRAYAAAFGLEPREVVGRTLAQVHGDDAWAAMRPHYDKVFAGRATETGLTLPYPHLGRRFVHLATVPVRAADGSVTSVVSSHTDISQRRRAEKALHERERGFKTLAENSPDVIARLDRELRHVYINRAAESAFGMRVADLLGRTPAEAGLPEDIAQAARQALDEGAERHFAFRRGFDGRTRHYSGRAIPEFDRNGQAETILVIIYDITQRTESEQEREALLAREQAAREQAEAAARARDQFLAIVSHELRSPLNGIQSWAHVLEQQVHVRTPAFDRALAGIRTGVEQQVRLIEDLLDATRIVSGQLRLSKQPFALVPVVEAALESVRARAQAKAVTIEKRAELGNEQILGDPDRVQQIVWNLLDNAVKFVGEGGHVTLTVERDGRNAVITVRDDGRGIAPEFLPHLFDRFRQADASSTRRHEGLGLGLALVRHLVELHGGDVSAASPGKGLGATFRVRLPLRQYAPPATAVRPGEDETPLPSLAGLRVLLVDDQEAARESLSALLGNSGAEVFAAASGRAAIARLEEVGPDSLPDVLLCDIAMPEEDGYLTLKRIRAWETAHGVTHDQRVPAIALTAYAQREDRIRALASGYKMHLTKPVAPAELIVVIATVARRARLEPS